MPEGYKTNGISQLENSITAVREMISKSYMEQFTENDCQVLRVNDRDRVQTGIRLLKIDQIALSDELMESRLTSIYQTLKQLVNSCFMVIQGTGGEVSVYLGFQADAAGTAESALTQTLIGNFPGIVFESLRAGEIREVMDRIRFGETGGAKTVAAVSVVPSRREEQEETVSVQGMEKFIDSMQGKEFTAVIMASPYDEEAVNRKASSLEAVSTALSSLEQITVQNTESRTFTLTDSTARTLSETISSSINSAYSVGETEGTFSQSGKGKGFTVAPLGLGITFSGMKSAGTSSAQNVAATSGETHGLAFGKADMLSRAAGLAEGASLTVIKTETNKEIQNLRVKLDRQISRLRDSEAQGLWDCCGYFVAGSNDTAIVAANSFQGLVSGDDTSIEQTAVSLWQPTLPDDPVPNHEMIRSLTDSLALGVAPVFYCRGEIRRMESTVTGRELSRLMGFPRKSAGTVSVMHMAAFGRNIHLIGGKKKEAFEKASFPVGKIMHMGRIDGERETRIELQKLNAHTLAVGATGAGKTTALRDILERLAVNAVPFTVIEPAKGEYGELLAKLPDIAVYSTTPFRYQMLRLNPFAFGDSVHILNHMERLISVFSTAWPLYAAQPAVLRDCVRMAYVKCGWDITNSICLRPVKKFPTFVDVLAELPEAIKRSRFVGEAKGTYEGALQTRLSMLTEGIFKDIFCSGYDTSDRELFDRTAVIDLSRLGSQETLSLIMGVLLIRLYEHRIGAGKNKVLTHVTVLEEAHNILKGSFSGPQGEDVASIGSKSVEVLTKCITELRFTGEGFIIADQSPGELDGTAIKNTSTKIVMRLQGKKDQDAVASALSLTGEQAAELSKLDNGVASVFQEGWIEPVLTKFDYCRSRYSLNEGDSRYKEYAAEAPYSDICVVRGFLVKQVLQQFCSSGFDLPYLEQMISDIGNFSRWKLADYRMIFRENALRYDEIRDGLTSNKVKYPFYGKLIRDLLDAGNLFEAAAPPLPDTSMKKPYSKDPEYQKVCGAWKEGMLKILERYCTGLSEGEKELALKLLLLADGTEKKNQILVIATVF